jgi:hypothetical protein
MTLQDMMPDTYEYPNPTETPLKPGVQYQYISQTHLNGWINYVRPVAAYVITRYADDGYEGNLRRVEAWHAKPTVHTKLYGIAGDDVIILARGETAGDWWVFEYDCDVSDCFLGRFSSSASEAEVRAMFDEYVSERDGPPPIPLDVRKFDGWVSG